MKGKLRIQKLIARCIPTYLQCKIVFIEEKQKWLLTLQVLCTFEAQKQTAFFTHFQFYIKYNLWIT